MQIQWAEVIKLLSTAEFWLIILIAVYLSIAIGVASYRLRKYLKSHPDEDAGRDYHFQHENVSLTLAGFSLTAIALLVSLYSNFSTVSPTLAFFSLSFLFLILSPTFLRFRFVNFFVYVADVLFNAGLLSIACGFLVFFGEVVSWTDWSTVIFSILVGALFFASLANYILFESIVGPKRKKK